MNVLIIAVDKLREAYVRTGCELYVKRLHPYHSVTTVDVRKGSGAAATADEGRRILERIEPTDVVWALDREGDAIASAALAKRIALVERAGRRRMVLAIGGADGLSEAVLARADLRWSLSPLTFLHEMTRLIVLEQLYRAAKIARGEPYHR